MEETVEGSLDYELSPSPPAKGDNDDPGYVPPAHAQTKSKRGRKRKKKEPESDHGGGEGSDGEDKLINHVPGTSLMEYQWSVNGGESVWYMLQEQVGEYLDIRGMQRRYPDLERRTVDVVEKKYLMDNDIVTETQGNMGLVALRSDEVLELMEEEFPSKHKEYLEIIAERQTQLAIDKNLLDHYVLARSEVTQDPPSNANELIQSMVEEAAAYNKLCCKIRKTNRRITRKSNQVPRPVIGIDTAAAASRRHTNRYPVALIPGQYTDHVRRYTSEELKSLPLSTVTSLKY